MNETEVVELIRPRLKGCTITDVKDFGDAFAIFFVNDEYHKSGKVEDLMIGAGPIIYIKNTGEIFETGSGQSAERYIKAFRECGDVYGRESETLVITEIPQEHNEKKATLNLKTILGLPLSESKTLIEKIVKDGKIEITLKNERGAEDAKNAFANLGFKANRLWKKAR